MHRFCVRMFVRLFPLFRRVCFCFVYGHRFGKNKDYVLMLAFVVCKYIIRRFCQMHALFEYVRLKCVCVFVFAFARACFYFIVGVLESVSYVCSWCLADVLCCSLVSWLFLIC